MINHNIIPRDSLTEDDNYVNTTSQNDIIIDITDENQVYKHTYTPSDETLNIYRLIQNGGSVHAGTIEHST